MRRRKTNEEFKKEVYKSVGDSYRVVGSYVNFRTKIEMLHVECRRIWEIAPKEFLRGRRCRKCSYEKRMNARTKTQDEYVRDVFELEQGQYRVLGIYVNNSTKIYMSHVGCGNTWKTAPRDFLSGKRCPQCNFSKGEKAIQQFLENNKISFTPQSKFDECRNERLLPFDFYLPDYNTCIEYQGEQHFKAVKYFGGKKKLKQQKNNDNIKRQFCIDNKINLCEIKYTDFDNIETILKDALRSL